MNERIVKPLQRGTAQTFTPLSRGVLQRKCACGGGPGLTGECEGCRKKKLLQRRAGHQSEPSEVPPIVHEVLRSPGQPLDPATRAFFEPRFGHDFSNVRIHDDSRSADSAQTIGALGYTVGEHIVIGAAGQSLGSGPGRRLLAHELAHVLQQARPSRIRRIAEEADESGLKGKLVGRDEPRTVRRVPWMKRLDACHSEGVPCPPYEEFGVDVCRFHDCIKAVTSGLPGAISPGVCIYDCDDRFCTCVLVRIGGWTACIFGLCDDKAQASLPGGMERLADESVASARLAMAETGGEPLPVQAKLLVGDPDDPLEREADRVADAVMADVAVGQHQALGASAQAAPVLQRQFRTPRVTIRSPVAEEAVTQLTELLPGRALTTNERRLARGVFGDSIDYSRVRLIPTSVLEYRTIANTIRIPENFSIANEEMAQTFIHEMTHVWQYQHGGTSYMSISLGTQIAAHAGRGNRNFAYDYRISAGQTFFDFTPEQQAFMAENNFAMLRDQTAIPRDQAAGTVRTYQSNHLDPATGFRAPLTDTDRLSEISRELPLHEPLMAQMRAALRRPEADLLMLRAREVMQIPGQEFGPVPVERQIAPVKPLIEVRFPGL